MTGLRVIDSSVWVEYFADTERAGMFAEAIEDFEHLIVPVVVLYEVAKKFRRERGEEVAQRVVQAMRHGQVVEIDVSLATEASALSLPLADSLIYATVLRTGATLWTQDAHFDGLAQVRYFPK